MLRKLTFLFATDHCISTSRKAGACASVLRFCEGSSLSILIACGAREAGAALPTMPSELPVEWHTHSRAWILLNSFTGEVFWPRNSVCLEGVFLMGTESSSVCLDDLSTSYTFKKSTNAQSPSSLSLFPPFLTPSPLAPLSWLFRISWLFKPRES